MHILQPKHTILKKEETDILLKRYNISLPQFTQIKIIDPALPQGAVVGDVIKIERKDEHGTHDFFRVVVV